MTWTAADPRWYRQAFGEDWLETFALCIPSGVTEVEVEFVASRLELGPDSELLDLGCGHGRHSVELARRGVRVTGVDLSEASLAAARVRADEAGVKAEFVRQDLLDLGYESASDAAIMMFTVFGCLPTDDEHQEVLRRAARALRPGGRFLLDTTSALGVLRDYRPEGWQELPGGELLLQRRRYDPAGGRNEVRALLVHPDGRRTELTWSYRLFTLAELMRMLTVAGLHVEAVYGDFDGRPFGWDSPRMIAVSSRPGPD